MATAQRALDAGAVREHHGTIDVDFGKIGSMEQGASPPPPGMGGPMARGPMVAPDGMVYQPAFTGPARSDTVSPGIDKSGNRIDYGSMSKELAKRQNKRTKK